MKKINTDYLNKIGLDQQNSTINLLFDYDLCFERIDDKLYVRGHGCNDLHLLEYQENAEAVYLSLTGNKL